ncbi:hypothetical protein MKX08_005592 [Trichoderma sp. CBMAI-0020]|nr:hypothetical protein MKX08_005592 [Trichoderma sp. CBMAI-0020]
MVLALLIPVLASGVAAQHLTLPLVDYGAVVNAVNSDDPGYQICTAVADFVSGCVDQAGGATALSTADPLSLVKCACCVGTTDVAPAYSSCANYLVSEAPQLSSQISACGNSPQICLGNSGGGGSVTKESEPSSTAQSSRSRSPPSAASTSIPSPASSPSKIPQQTSATQGGSTASTTAGSAASAVTTYASACISMVDIFEQCTKNTPGFTNLVYSEQAYCYCCRSALGGEVTWTDEIDTYASTCRDWAATISTGDALTAYDVEGVTQCANNNKVAKTFATFCDHFSDACDVTTKGPSSTANDDPFPPPDSTGSSGDSSAGGNGGQVTVTVTQPRPTTTSHNAAPTARAGLAAGALAIAGFAIML